jgi:hypothetical protein
MAASFPGHPCYVYASQTDMVALHLCAAVDFLAVDHEYSPSGTTTVAVEVLDHTLTRTMLRREKILGKQGKVTLSIPRLEMAAASCIHADGHFSLRCTFTFQKPLWRRLLARGSGFVSTLKNNGNSSNTLKPWFSTVPEGSQLTDSLLDTS